MKIFETWKINKRGQIWVSAALYTALGVILVTLILSVGMPFVDKIKSRNVVVQTKNVMFEFDKAIHEVYNEGYGSRRPLFVDLAEGEFRIYDYSDVGGKRNRVEWSVVSDENLGIEANVLGVDCGDLDQDPIIIKEGRLNICSEKLGQGYKIYLFLDFNNEGLKLERKNDNMKILSGKYNLRFEHIFDNTNKESRVQIRES